MTFDGANADEDLSSDLGVREPPRDELEDLALAWCETGNRGDGFSGYLGVLRDHAGQDLGRAHGSVFDLTNHRAQGCVLWHLDLREGGVPEDAGE